MKHQKLPYSFNECLTYHSPFWTQGNTNYLVLFPATEEELPRHNQNIIDGYLCAAECIVRSIVPTNRTEEWLTDDRVTLPLLHLYSHAIELALKYLIVNFYSHSLYCGRLKSMKNKEVDGLMLGHELSKQITFLKKVIPSDGQHLHYFKGFKKIADFIKKFDKFGVNSVSTRYSTDINEDLQFKIHKKQSYCKIDKMHENVKQIIYSIIDYLNDKNFNFCEGKCFSQTRIDELNTILAQMNGSKSIFNKYEKDRKKCDKIYPLTRDKNCPHVFTVDEMTIKNIIMANTIEKEFKEKISGLGANTIAELALGFRFNSGPEVTTLASIKRLNNEENVDTIVRHALAYKKSIGMLREHIDYLKLYL